MQLIRQTLIQDDVAIADRLFEVIARCEDYITCKELWDKVKGTHIILDWSQLKQTVNYLSKQGRLVRPCRKSRFFKATVKPNLFNKLNSSDMLSPQGKYITINRAQILVRPGQNPDVVRRKYESVFERKVGDLFLDNNPKPPIDFEREAEKAELNWQQGVRIAQLFFKHDLTTVQIAETLCLNIELVNSFISDECYAHRMMKELEDRDKEGPESLSETLQRLSK